jgi:phospholipase C
MMPRDAACGDARINNTTVPGTFPVTAPGRAPNRIALAACLGALCGHPGASASPIKHVIMIMEENRSFDHYFGTYPGANGFPNGTCVPLNPAQPTQGCVAPFHDPHDVSAGGPHGGGAAIADIDGTGANPPFDGFVYQQATGAGSLCSARQPPGVQRPKTCQGVDPGILRHDVMGYHNASEIPNYWAYAQHFVLQDNLFEGVRGASPSAHLEIASEWSAICTQPSNVATCTTTLTPKQVNGTVVLYPWVNLFQLMDLNGVSWKYYLGTGQEPDCDDDEMTCEPSLQANGILSYWNPAPGFAWVEAQGANYIAAHNPQMDQFLVDIKNGALPQVSWIVPPFDYSDHPASGVTAGQDFVTSLVNAVMQSPYWQNTAIFIAWDDWGGFYDHVLPPTIDMNKGGVQGYGLRVPGLLVSAWAKPGYIDNSLLSFDAYAVLFENLFMGGARLDPTAMGEPDNRPTIRDELTTATYPGGTTAPIGQLIKEFDFNQTPLPTLVLNTHVPPGIQIKCGSTNASYPEDCATNKVTVSWQSVSGTYIPGPFTYHVLRDGAVPSVDCTSTTKTTCIDSKAPAGTHYYTVYSVDPNNVASPVSASAEADVP